MENTLNKIDSFKELKYDWDSYGANEISKQSIETSKEIVKIINELINNEIYAFPMPNGGVQIEFQNIELEVYNESTIELLQFDIDDELIDEYTGNINEIIGHLKYISL